MAAAAYYNEIDPYAADWLRNLIAAGHIAPGDVDERSIEDVHPDDLRPYTQCHFFAGIGVWSYALRRAGWPDDRPVWTGSCPCQPFSAAGKGTAFDDERHLWPDWRWLIQECRPPVVFGEQVASKDAEPWLDLVSTELEALAFAVAACAFPSASIGAPHIRDRTYFVAHATGPGFQGRQRSGQRAGSQQPAAERSSRIGGLENTQHSGLEAGQSERRRAGAVVPPSAAGGMGNAADQPCQRDAGGVSRAKASEHGARVGIDGSQPVRPEHAGASVVRGMADALLQQRPDGQPGLGHEHDPAGRHEGAAALAGLCGDLRPGPVNGFWRAADWLLCRDGKWRPVEASPQPLVDGSAESLGRVRADIIAAIEEEIDASAMESEIRRPETLRALRDHLGAQTRRFWAPGGLPGLHEAPFLLAFVRQLTTQGWAIQKGSPLPRPEAADRDMRSLRDGEALASSPRQRGLDGQPTREPSDAVRVLSCILARHAQAAWGDAYAAYAEIGFPLGRDSRSRVGRLRAYGNAINAQQAQIFIEESMRCI